MIEFFVEQGYWTKDERFYSRAPSISKYLYACLIYKKCCICGVPAVDLHHVDRIGSASRKTTEHIGRKVMALCRVHHGEVDIIGQETFDEKYKVFGIKCDRAIAEKYSL